MVLGWCWGGVGVVLGWSRGGIKVVLGGVEEVLGWCWGGVEESTCSWQS